MKRAITGTKKLRWNYVPVRVVIFLEVIYNGLFITAKQAGCSSVLN